MERGTGDDPKLVKKFKNTGNKVQSLGQQQQLCAVEDGHQSCSEQQLAAGRQFSAADDESSKKRHARDRHQLLNMLPEELWRMILVNVESYVDLQNISNSSPFFRELLLPKRVNFLFKNVWQIMERQDKKARLKNKIMWSRDEAIKESLPLRLVSRSWSKDFDSLHESHTLQLYCRHDLTRLLSRFATTHGPASTRSPFVGKSMYMSVDYHGIQVFVENGVHALLDTYGQHIWHCTFVVTLFQLTLSLITFFSRFTELLQRMPSLKTLHVSYWKFTNSLQSSEESGMLNTELISPALPELQELSVAGGSLPVPILRQFIRTNGHVSTSSSTTTAGGCLEGPFVSNLKSLSLQPCPQNYFEMIMDNHQFQWHLTTLSLDLPDCGFTEWPSVFTALKNKFGNTLTDLNLTVRKLECKADGDQILEERKQFNLHFPHLTRLYLQVGVPNKQCVDPYLTLIDHNHIFTTFKKDGLEPNVEYCKGWNSSPLYMWPITEFPP